METYNSRFRMRALLAVALALGVCFAAEVFAQQAGKPKAQDTQRPKESVWSLTLKGGIVMIPLGICSVVALAISIERFMSLRRKKIIPPDFINGLIDTFVADGGEVTSAVKYCDGCHSPVGNIFKAGIMNLYRGQAFVEKAIEDAGSREVDKMKRSLRGLAIITAVSPLLGLLGTVYGMISAFETSTYVGMGKGELLARGIYEALVTTAAGLTIAIPALLVYQYFNGRVDALVDEIDDMGIDFMGRVTFGNPAAQSQVKAIQK